MSELYKNNRIGYICYVSVLSFLVSLAMGIKLGEVKVSKAASGSRILALGYKFRHSFVYDKTNNLLVLCLLGIVFALLVRREYSLRCKKCSIIFAIGTSVLLVLAKSLHMKASLTPIFASYFTITKAVLMIAGYAVLLFYLVNALFEVLLPKLRYSEWIKNTKWKRVKITFWSCFAAIMIAWLPYIIVYYPCNFCRDARDEIAQMLGDEEVSRTAKSINYPKEATTLLNNHHPITYTILVGGAAKIGLAIGNINLMIFLLALLQMIALAMIYSDCVNYIKSLDVPLVFVYATLGFFMFFPLVPMYAFTITKDSLFGGFMILVTIGLFKLAHREEAVFESKKEKWYLFGSCLGLLLFRNNGLYILLVVLAVLLLRYRKSRKKIRSVLFMIGIPLLLYWLVLLKILLPLFHIPEGSPREMLSIPIQQVARYASEWGEDGFKDGEIETLDKILCFDEDLDVLVKRYDPVLSDPVKNQFNKDYTSEELKGFLMVWGKLLLRHPGTCVEATLNNCYYLFSADYDKLITYNGVNTKGEWYGLHNIGSFSFIRTTYFQIIKIFGASSMLGWAFSIGPWNYLFLLCMLYAFYKKMYSYFLMTLPVVLNVFICVAGPVCYMRYAIEWIVVIPLFASLAWISLCPQKAKV